MPTINTQEHFFYLSFSSLSLSSRYQMETSKPQSFFQDIRSRELNGFRLRKRPYVADESSQFHQIGVVSVDHNGSIAPPMALSFCKTSKNSHILAVTDEDGYVSLYNTRLSFPSSSTYQKNTEKSRVCDWVAHDNAIFDLCWIKVKLWDVHVNKCIGALIGHTGSVKSICSHPTNNDLIVSGSRDGSFAIWDLRCFRSSGRKLCISPTASINGAHIPTKGKRTRGGKAASMSITSVLYLKDEVSIATAGAVDRVVKFWDTRSLKTPVTHACPDSKLPTQKERRLHGISSLSQDKNGVFLSASCMDNRIYLYSLLQVEKGPVRSFQGNRIESFFVKAALSPDAAHILSGSSDGNAYLWQVNKPQVDPTILKSHGGEVTAVDWCPSEIGKIATCSDDFTVRFWNINSSCYSKTRSPSSIRKRATALPSMECRRLFTENEQTNKKIIPEYSLSNEGLLSTTN